MLGQGNGAGRRSLILGLLVAALFAAAPAAHAGTIATGLGAGGVPQVGVYDSETLAQLSSFLAYDSAFGGGVRVAAGDVNGDGVVDIVTGTGLGGLPHVKVFDGATGAEIRSFFAFDPGFTGGVHVAAGDINNDGNADIVVGADAGGVPHVKVFDGLTSAELRSFLAYDAGFAGGVRVAAGDVNGDGFADIVTGAGPSAGGHVRVFDGQTGTLLASFFAFDPSFAGGIFVAAGDVNDDGNADIVVGADAGGVPHVKVFDGLTGGELRSFFAYDVSFAGGVRVAAGDVNGDGTADIVTGTGAGAGSHVKAFSGRDGSLLRSFFPLDPSFTGGVYVAASSLPAADRMAPVLTLPGTVTVDATGPAGAVVSFTASAFDAVDGVVPVTCVPPSGSTFPIGETIVTCTAIDAAGNSATGSFLVHVNAPAEQLAALLAAVEHVRPGSALSAKIRLAQRDLAAGDIAATCTDLDGFIALAKAQSGKKLSEAEAGSLIAAAQQIEAVLGC